VCCSVFQYMCCTKCVCVCAGQTQLCVVICCSVLQCVAVCCRVLQCADHSTRFQYMCCIKCVCVCARRVMQLLPVRGTQHFVTPKAFLQRCISSKNVVAILWSAHHTNSLSVLHIRSGFGHSFIHSFIHSESRNTRHTATTFRSRSGDSLILCCGTLQNTATHCNTLQHTTTHCNTLQHTTPQTNAWHNTTTPRSLGGDSFGQYHP